MKDFKLKVLYLVIGVTLALNTNANEITEITVQQDNQEQRIIEQIEQNLVRPSITLAPIGNKKEEDYDAEADIPCFNIAQIQIAVKGERHDLSNTFQYLSDELNYGKNKVAGRCIGKVGLRSLLEYSQVLLVDKGYITSRVIAEPQDLTTGQLTLTVIPGLVNRIYHSTETDKSIHTQNAIVVNEDTVLSLRNIEKSLENLRLSGGYTSTIDIKPIENENFTDGAEDYYGYSDIVIEKKLDRKLNFGLSLDDSGSESTGKYQATVNLKINEPLRSSDILYISYLNSVDPWNKTKLPASNHNFYVSYQYPYKNWLFNASYNDYRYDQTLAGLNYDPVYQGISKTVNFQIDRSLWRTANSKLDGYMSVQRRRSSNYIDDLEILVQQRQTTFYDAGVQYERHLTQGEKVSMSLSHRQGSGAFDAKPIPETFFSEVAVRPSIWNTEFAYRLPFVLQNQKMGYDLQLSGQYSPDQLSSQDRFAIGSRNTVRGFDGSSMLSGELGLSISNELNWQASFIPLANQVYLGVDSGWVDGDSTQYLSGKSLTGVVAGVRLYDTGFYLDGFIGKGLKAPKGIDKHTHAGFKISINY